MRRPGSILFLAVVLGALCAAMVYRYVRTQRDELERARRAAGGATVELLVANTGISAGSRIEPSQVRLIPWPVDVKPEGALTDVTAVEGGIARTTIEKNQPVLEANVVKQGTGLLPLIITEGMRGMSVKVDEVTGVSGFITPNSRVDVIAAGEPDGNGDRERRSRVILQNVRVLATGKFIEQRDEKPVEVPTVTLLVTPEDAEKLTLATYRDPVRLALRNFRDEQVVTTPGLSMVGLFAGDGRGRSPAAPAGSGGQSVEILLGDKLVRQPLL
jgi:pilus assembly protein CpaB